MYTIAIKISNLTQEQINRIKTFKAELKEVDPPSEEIALQNFGLMDKNVGEIV